MREFGQHWTEFEFDEIGSMIKSYVDTILARRTMYVEVEGDLDNDYHMVEKRKKIEFDLNKQFQIALHEHSFPSLARVMREIFKLDDLEDVHQMIVLGSTGYKQNKHSDYESTKQFSTFKSPTRSNIFIPAVNCENTPCVWYDGDEIIDQVTYNPKNLYILDTKTVHQVTADETREPELRISYFIRTPLPYDDLVKHISGLVESVKTRVPAIREEHEKAQRPA